MKEYKVGEEITLVVKESNFDNPVQPCEGCFFLDSPMKGDCYPMCEARIRKDGKNAIFVEKGK